MTVPVNYSKEQLGRYLDDIYSLGNLGDKSRAFEWNVFNTDRHDTVAIWRTLPDCCQVEEQSSIILLNTVRAKDCSLVEGMFCNHHMTFTAE